MILYFSATGNSEYVAKRIGDRINDLTADLFEKIRDRDFSEIHSERPWVIVAPTYAWRIPRILEEWLTETDLAGSKNMYFSMTCGGSAGNAEKYLKKLTESKGMNYLGCYPIVMPENYIAMFSTPNDELALKIIESAEIEIDAAAEFVKNKTAFPKTSPKPKDKICSGIVNRAFYPLFVRAKKFYATDKCVSCGNCAAVCPLNNVRIDNGKPAWRDNCTHCMACICRCPTEAIEYGKHSVGLPRYICPKRSNTNAVR